MWTLLKTENIHCNTTEKNDLQSDAKIIDIPYSKDLKSNFNYQ